MKSLHLNFKPIVLALFAAGVLSACGGGGGGSPTAVDSGQNTPPPVETPPGETPPGETPPPSGGDPDTAMTMSCIDGTEYQCSGGTVIKTDNGVMLTRSGVQVFAISTSDLQLDTAVPPAPAGVDVTNPRGFALPYALAPEIKGVAEVRVQKATDNAVTRVGLLLNDFGLKWDGKTARPLIVETFGDSIGRVELDTDPSKLNALVIKPLPAGTDTSFFDRKTQANYANNTYRATTPIKPTLLGAGDGGWRTGGIGGDWAETGRVHEDGDLDAPTSPAPGTKGHRDFTNIGYEFANMTVWNSQDTVNIAEWTTEPKVEHNKERRGVVAFGNVTSPDAVPTSGTATYTGMVYGLYGVDTQADPDPFVGLASMEVNYATGAVKLTILDTKTFNAAEIPVPAAFTADASKGAILVNGASVSTSNYFTGTVGANGLAGGVSGRYFGPNAKEIGGTFQLTGPSNASIIGGFIGRKP